MLFSFAHSLVSVFAVSLVLFNFHLTFITELVERKSLGKWGLSSIFCFIKGETRSNWAVTESRLLSTNYKLIIRCFWDKSSGYYRKLNQSRRQISKEISPRWINNHPPSLFSLQKAWYSFGSYFTFRAKCSMGIINESGSQRTLHVLGAFFYGCRLVPLVYLERWSFPWKANTSKRPHLFQPIFLFSRRYTQRGNVKIREISSNLQRVAVMMEELEWNSLNLERATVML